MTNRWTVDCFYIYCGNHRYVLKYIHCTAHSVDMLTLVLVYRSVEYTISVEVCFQTFGSLLIPLCEKQRLVIIAVHSSQVPTLCCILYILCTDILYLRSYMIWNLWGRWCCILATGLWTVKAHTATQWYTVRCARLWKVTPWWWLRCLAETCSSIHRIVVQRLVMIIKPHIFNVTLLPSNLQQDSKHISRIPTVPRTTVW
jgi:hypothetical protein